MATTKQNNKKSKNGSAKFNGRPRRQRRAPAKVPVDPKEAQLVQLLADPCNADYVNGSVYAGESGIVSRFAVDSNIGAGVGETSGVIAFHPNDNTVCIITATSPGTTFTINAGSFIYNQVPGQTFLLGSAAKMRALAACITALPNSTVLEAKGDIAVGNVSLSSLYGTTASVNSIFSLLNVKGPVVRKNYEAKFVPGLMDSRYSSLVVGGNPSNSGTDDSDTNCIVLAWRSLAPASGISYRLTSVVEWTPKQGAGLTTSSNTEAGLDVNKVVAAMHNAKPNWWHNLMDGVGMDLGGAAKALTQRAVSYGVAGLTRAAGMLLL